tara:strand:- start:197 stop:523 length:327 start_codon:yes stop_codon:yes gene_type:complete
VNIVARKSVLGAKLPLRVLLASTLESERVSERERALNSRETAALVFLFTPSADQPSCATDTTYKQTTRGALRYHPEASGCEYMACGAVKRKIKPYREDPAGLDEGLDK